jgi:hypothetical protein
MPTQRQHKRALLGPTEPFESDAPPRMPRASDVAPAIDRDAFAADLWRTLFRNPSYEAADRGIARARELGMTDDELSELSLRFHSAAGAFLEAVATNVAAREAVTRRE